VIISNLVGGLGNQMFQYACGRSLSLELNQNLKFSKDMIHFYKNPHNGIELDRIFELNLNLVSRFELAKTIGRFRSYPLTRKVLEFNSLYKFRGPRFIIEPQFRYLCDLDHRARNGAYLQGYWQSERYFKKYSTIIKEDFNFKNLANITNINNIKLAELINRTNSLGIHIRRGDYVNNRKTYSIHGVCSIEYYLSAVKNIQEKYPNPLIVAFSDDPDWVSREIAPYFSKLIVVSHNKGLESYIDMWLMSLCKHNIIANSSFSWWAAWLNKNPFKIVIAPKNWFANKADNADLLPPSWIRL
jgi:hypothetical protein